MDGKKAAPRAVKKLKATAAASAYQKAWFAGLRERVEAGEDFAYLNADVPMEILRAMDIPFVVNQWWAAICSAKQMTPRYYGLLREAGYRDDLCSYCATALAESLDPNDRTDGPWGGLPHPTLAITRLTCDCQSKIFELFARNHGAQFYAMENTIPRKTPDKWWELAPDRWEELYDSDRLDAAVEELKELIRFLEMKTGRMFDVNRLCRVMELINEQETWYRKTRDLIADCDKAPVTVVDTINAVMQAQWQRGTAWAADHAKSLYEEIRELADRGEQAAPNEKYRLHGAPRPQLRGVQSAQPEDHLRLHQGLRAGRPLCRVIGREDLLDDPRYQTPHSRFVHRDTLDPVIAAWAAQHIKQEAMDILAKADVPAGALLDTEDITNDPQYAERGMIVEVEHPQLGKVKVPGFAPRLSENHIDYAASPALGEHNAEIYGGVLGLSEAELAALKEKQVI